MMVIDKIISAENKYNMLRGKSVLVALSGGADSVTLLYTLLRLKDEFNIQISAAHVNHMLRGAESDRDQAFCAKLCKKLEVPFTTKQINIEKERLKGESTELAARRLRYCFLNQIPSDVIATAHTADDNLETVLFNLARGTALKGLCGIPPIRGKIVRPLIFCARSDIEQYCNEMGLQFVTDSTNVLDAYTRNRIRKNVVPVLKQINPLAAQSVIKTSESLRLDAEFLDSIAEESYNQAAHDGGLLVEQLKKLHKSILSRVIAKYHIRVIGYQPDYFHTEQIVNLIWLSFGKTGLSGDYSATVSDGMLKIEPNKSQNQGNSIYYVTTELMTVDNFKILSKINNLLLKNSIDYDKITGKLTIRNRLAGDKIKLAGRSGTKELRKLYNEYKIPTARRNAWPIACDDTGVIWVHTIGVNQSVCIDEKTKTILVFNVEISHGENNLGDVNYVNG